MVSVIQNVKVRYPAQPFLYDGHHPHFATPDPRDLPCRDRTEGSAPGRNPMNPDELRENLVGAWRLVSYRATAVDNGEVVEPFGPRPQGLITYTPSGHMSAQIMRPLRPRFRRG